MISQPRRSRLLAIQHQLPEGAEGAERGIGAEGVVGSDWAEGAERAERGIAAEGFVGLRGWGG